MKLISGDIYGLLVSQGIANGRAGTRASGGMKERGAASDGARSQVKADAAGGMHRPIGPHTGGGKRDQSGMRVKGTPTEAGAEFTGGGQTQGGRNHSASARVYLAYVSTMPTRQGAIRRTPSLVCIEGGKR